MNILYIGQYTTGTTSKMRADQLKSILQADLFHIIDTHIPFHQTARLWRSFGFRYKRGPLILKINSYIINQVSSIRCQVPEPFDLIWVDKAIFLTQKTTKTLKSLTNTLVHFTPDPAFTFHKSHLFRKSLSLYTFAITTKVYELKFFEEYLKKEQIIYTTQGFDKKLHIPKVAFQDKTEGILFIGHCEKERELIIQQLIHANINVAVAGIKWEPFTEKHRDNPYLHYLGKGIYGVDYIKTLSSYQFSWGSVSKWIPELHTTRTFEIPACGTTLITERNTETSSFFNEDEAIFYDSMDEMVESIRYYQNHTDELEALTKKGTLRVNADGRNYESILREVLERIGLKV